MITDERETLINKLTASLHQYMTDMTLEDLKAHLYIQLNDYEITSRCTEIVELKEDRNEYLLKNFLIAKSVKGCTKRTIQYYGRNIPFILRKIGKTVDDITPEDLRLYMALRLRRDHVSKTTVGNEMRNMSSFFDWLYKEELIKKNPMYRVEKIKAEKTKKEALTEMEIEKLREAALGIRERMLVELFLSTGCRVSEVTNIKISDIEDDRILVFGKGEKERYVYLNAKTQLLLREYIFQRKDTNPYLLPKGKGVAFMTNKKGIKRRQYYDWWKNPDYIAEGPMDKSTIEATFRNMAKRAGVERANPHKFRRTCATLALRRGMPVEQVSKMLGHDNIATTQIYLDLNEEDLRIAHKKYVV